MKSPEQQKRDEDWSFLANQVVGGESFPPLRRVQKCPVCDGQGIVSKPPWVAGDVEQWTSSESCYPCRPCNGSGVIPL